MCFALYITGSPDTVDEQKRLASSVYPLLSQEAFELGINFRVVAMWDAEETRKNPFKPKEKISQCVRGVNECNVFVAIIGNEYGLLNADGVFLTEFLGFSKSKTEGNFLECFAEAENHFAWLDEHRLDKQLSLLEIEIDTAMRASSKERGSGYLKVSSISKLVTQFNCVSGHIFLLHTPKWERGKAACP